MESFLGGNIRKTKIEGMAVERFINLLVNDIMVQTGEILSITLGNKYLDLGIFASHREINRRIHLYKKWGK